MTIRKKGFPIRSTERFGESYDPSNEFTSDRLEFPEPLTHVANDDDARFLSGEKQKTQIKPKPRSRKGHSGLIIILAMAFIIGATAFILPDTILELGMTPSLIAVSMISISMFALLISALLRINYLTQMIEQTTIKVEEAKQSVSKFDDIFTSFQGDILTVNKELKTNRAIFETQLNLAKSSIDNSVAVTTRLIADKTNDLSQQFKVSQNDVRSQDKLSSQQAQLAGQITNLEKQVKSLSDDLAFKQQDMRQDLNKALNKISDLVTDLQKLIPAKAENKTYQESQNNDWPDPTG